MIVELQSIVPLCIRQRSGAVTMDLVYNMCVFVCVVVRDV